MRQYHCVIVFAYQIIKEVINTQNIFINIITSETSRPKRKVCIKRSRLKFAIWKIPSIEEQTEPEIIEALHRIELREEAERREQFEKLYCEAMAIWAELSTSKKIKAFRIVRDKVSAHKEVRYVADKYQFVDIGTRGIKWGDLRSTIDRMKRLVELMGLLVRNAGFAWDMLDEQLSRASKGFWDISNAAEESIESGERKQ